MSTTETTKPAEIQAIVRILRFDKRLLEVTPEYPDCIRVLMHDTPYAPAGGTQVEPGTVNCAWFGKANETWGSDLYIPVTNFDEGVPTGTCHTDVDTDEPDAGKVATGILDALERDGYIWPKRDHQYNLCVDNLAVAFSYEIRKALTAEQLAEVQEKNRTESVYQNGCCATADVIDSNMQMSDAFINIMGQDDLLTDLWTDAWTKAKAAGFTLGEKEGEA